MILAQFILIYLFTAEFDMCDKLTTGLLHVLHKVLYKTSLPREYRIQIE